MNGSPKHWLLAAGCWLLAAGWWVRAGLGEAMGPARPCEAPNCLVLDPRPKIKLLGILAGSGI